MRTVVGVFGSMREAEAARRTLSNAGVPGDGISLVAGNDANRHKEYLDNAKEASTSTGAAAASAASFGGGVGLMAGLAALIIPGVGPIVAGGALATLLTGLGIGAAGGGLIGALKEMGISHEEAPIYEEAVRRGAIMLSAQVDEAREREAVDIMKNHGAKDPRDEVDTWKAEGWKGPHADPHPYTSVSSIRNYGSEQDPPPVEG